MVDGKRALLWTLWGRHFGFNWWHWGDGLIAALHVRSLDLLQPSSEAELVPCSSFPTIRVTFFHVNLLYHLPLWTLN
jgi:hypothetical protein